jgi:hypothetical protein
MSTVEIPRTEWTHFFHELSALHAGWRCKLEILGNSLGAQVESQGLPLAGIDADDGGHTRITVALGTRPDAHLTHVIDAPEHVWLQRSDASEDEVIEIESADVRTLLHLHADHAGASGPRHPGPNPGA